MLQTTEQNERTKLRVFVRFLRVNENLLMPVSNVCVTVFEKVIENSFPIPQLIPKIRIADIYDPGFVSLIVYLIVVMLL